MANVLEAAMIICFGLSWPINIFRLLKSKSTSGTSVLFYFLIDFGYVAGIAAKIVKHLNGVSTPGYVWFFYVLNFVMVLCGIIIYFRNKKLESDQKSGGSK